AMKDGKDTRRREPYRRRRSARGATARAATQSRLIGPGLRLIATLLAAAGPRPRSIEQESARLWGSLRSLSTRGAPLGGKPCCRMVLTRQVTEAWDIAAKYRWGC